MKIIDLLVGWCNALAIIIMLSCITIKIDLVLGIACVIIAWAGYAYQRLSKKKEE